MVDISQAAATAKSLRQKADEIDRLTGKKSLRDRDAERKRKERAEGKLVVIPKCDDPVRRAALEADDAAWLRWYFNECGYYTESSFWYDFTDQQQRMIAAIGRAIETGGDQSLAASRGEGKTSIARRLLLKYALQGRLSFSVLFAATGELAGDSLQAIKYDVERNERLLADYPEVCAPVRALEDTPQRAHFMLASGFRVDDGQPFEMAQIKFSWSGREVWFPDVPGSPARRAIIATRGLDSAVLGLNKMGTRPKLAIIDDPDSDETVYSVEQADKLEDLIDRVIGALGEQRRTVARVMLCTLRNRNCAAYRFTDRERKPSWRGERFRFLITPPTRDELWQEYVGLVQTDWREETNAADALYAEKFEEMNAGAAVANEHRFTPSERSALQHYYNLVARFGQEAVDTEYDNDPPEEMGAVDSGITADRVMHRLSGFARREVPSNCTVISQGIDVQKAGVHWVMKAWTPEATSYVVDYGYFEAHGWTYGTDEGEEFAVRNAILGRMEEMNKSELVASITLVDSGWKSEAVYAACREIGLGIYPAKGHGRSHGCATPNFHDIWKRTADRKPGDGWFMQKSQKQIWIVHCDTDRWKSFEHARWMTAEGKPGAAYVFGQMSDEEREHLARRMPRDVKEHFAFAKHVTAEMEVEDVVRGKLRREWRLKAGRAANHYFDASYLASVAASIQGIRLLGENVATGPTARPSAAQLAGR